MDNEILSSFGTRKCALCDRPVDKKYRPFCSKRCADIDLHRWFSGAYAVPAEEADEEFSINDAEDA